MALTNQKQGVLSGFIGTTWFLLVSVFNGISIIMDNLFPKSSLLNNSCGDIQPIARGQGSLYIS